ncbi:hypothetical protein M8494_31980 [Serratia ureilytica]
MALILHSHLPYDIISAVLAGAKYIIRDNYSSGICGLESWLTNYMLPLLRPLRRRKLETDFHFGLPQRRSDDGNSVIISAASKAASIPPSAFNCGASTESRCWPVSHYTRLADELVASTLMYASCDWRTV